MVAKICTICCSDVPSFSRPPSTCAKISDHRACNECWEVHLSSEVEQLDPRDIRCMFCQSTISRKELERLARKGTLHRYDSKLEDETRRRCQNRCAASVEHGLQDHDRTIDGRVFTCAFCDFRTCLDCDRPEHDNETCKQYRSRVMSQPNHVRAEFATKQKYKACPSCDVIFEMEKGCGYTQCTSCQHRFCSRCMIPWVGDGSAYLGGQDAHLPGCRYRTKALPSLHALKRRFELTLEGEQLKEQREERKREAKRQKLEKLDAGQLAAAESGK